MNTPDDPWLGANALDPAFRANPYPALARLREIAPVHQTPIGVWRLTRYDDVARLQRKHTLRLLAVQPQDRFPFEHALGFPVRGLHDELIELGTLEVRGCLDRLAHARRNARHETGVRFTGWHGAKLAP